MALTPSTMLALGTPAPDFTLPAAQGGAVSLGDLAGMPTLVMFICNHCPFVVHVRPHLAATCRELQDKGIAIVGICSNDATTHPGDSFEKMKEEVESAGYSFPYLHDESQAVAKAYRAACTPDFFLFDNNHRLVYRGQYDDSRPDNGKPVTGNDLRNAMEAVLGGRAAAQEQAPSHGCNIKWKPGNEPDYA